MLFSGSHCSLTVSLTLLIIIFRAEYSFRKARHYYVTTSVPRLHWLPYNQSKTPTRFTWHLLIAFGSCLRGLADHPSMQTTRGEGGPSLAKGARKRTGECNFLFLQCRVDNTFERGSDIVSCYPCQVQLRRERKLETVTYWGWNRHSQYDLVSLPSFSLQNYNR